MSKSDPRGLLSSVLVDGRQAVVLAVGTGLFLSFLIMTLLMVNLIGKDEPAPLQLKGTESAVAYPEGAGQGPPGVTLPTVPRSRYSLTAGEVNLPLNLGPSVTEEEVRPGHFYDLLLLWRPPGEQAFHQTKIINVEVVAVEAAAPPDRPVAKATLRLKRRDAELFQQHLARPEFKYQLVKAGR